LLERILNAMAASPPEMPEVDQSLGCLPLGLSRAEVWADDKECQERGESVETAGRDDGGELDSRGFRQRSLLRQSLVRATPASAVAKTSTIEAF